MAAANPFNPIEMAMMMSNMRNAYTVIAQVGAEFRDDLIEKGFTKAQANKIATHLLSGGKTEEAVTVTMTSKQKKERAAE